ncbi:beta-propeller domain-containing protein [Dactylosporangium sp. AC04546]|uniref:beta-propeller domain-containing protein n=1 Tax=Dactylosporangium sp. AC04546 TaxID=2862460 RepID=UPI001EDCADE3|nr:beta-propeller domain-containing protein [Dactylosporangium sp. AC04546]WVK83995.1 beta-propeller domain-containing protein [Dactylosporangium sp. AC04546]
MKRAFALIGAMCVCLSGCTADKPRPAPSAAAPQPAPALKLVAFESCDDLLTGLRAAAQEAVGPWGLGGITRLNGATDDAARAAGGAEAKGAAPGAETFSGTNTHEFGVDEPDLVKTDGKRIVTLTGGGVLTIVDAAAKRVTGELNLTGAGDANGKRAGTATSLLLSGDRVLVLGYDYRRGGAIGPDNVKVPMGVQVTLVDIAGTPKVLGRYTTDGAIVDARQVGSTARVVVRSTPRLRFPDTSKLKDDEARLAANRSAIAAAPLSDWLPRWDAEDAAGKHTNGQFDCGSVSRPERYSGTAMLTVLSFDLGGPALGGGDPVTVVADGDTVYANGPSLYVASNQRWRVAMPMATTKTAPRFEPPRTQLFKFDISGAGKPRYVASGEVPGWLLNQYSMSEWDGNLRVATTDANERGEQTSSSVYVLKQDGGRLAETGHVGGLGKGERIYSVRFIATLGYVVTFRQTDPLYTLDLSDPAAPKAVGELKITGYSAYLHPAGAGRLIGVGQEATERGRVQGTQISLFDVHDPAKPTRLAQHQVPKSSSEAEFDPHAFLYWPETGLLVVPLFQEREAGALVLTVGDKSVTPAGTIRHPGQYTVISRSLVIGGTLWTLSDAGLKANDAVTLAEQGWLPL